jgi:hypothetical protein
MALYPDWRTPGVADEDGTEALDADIGRELWRTDLPRSPPPGLH